jgi:hypothetical protein
MISTLREYEMKTKLACFAAFGALLGFGSQLVHAAPDWSQVPKRDIQVFHPGVVSHEWDYEKVQP